MPLILGIDPGISGAAALISTDRGFHQVAAFKKQTPQDMTGWLTAYQNQITMAFLEKVGAMPKQGVSSTFKFGVNYGWWQGVLTTLKIPHQYVYPLKWQTVLGCRSGGDKRVTKQRAQELFPSDNITHLTADALLIAEYGRRLIINEKSPEDF